MPFEQLIIIDGLKHFKSQYLSLRLIQVKERVVRSLFSKRFVKNFKVI